jgi:RimJ/RimL family protein N-acetyltransferase
MDAEEPKRTPDGPTCAPCPEPGRLRLRELAAADLPTMFGYQSDPESNHMAAVVPRTWEQFAAHWEKALASPEVTTRGIVLDEHLIGQIACFMVDEQSWVGYWIDREHWGRGHATKALAELLELIPRRPLHARVAVHNVASLRVLQKCGFLEQERCLCPGDERYLPCEEVILKLA